MKPFEDLIEKHRSMMILCAAQQKTQDVNSAPVFENRIAFSINETAVRLGVSPRSIERLIKRGEIECKRAGRRVLIPTSTIEAWLTNRSRP